MLARVTEVVRDPALAGALGVKVLPESNKAGQAVAADRPEDGVSKVFSLHRDPVFADFAHSAAVVDAVAELIAPDVDVFLSQFIFKTPGAWGQPWHQDSFYFPFEPARPVVGVWLAVTEATLVNGCLHVLPASQPSRCTRTCRTAAPRPTTATSRSSTTTWRHPSPSSWTRATSWSSTATSCTARPTTSPAGIRAAMVYHYAAAGTHRPHRGVLPPINDWVPARRGGRPTAPQRAAA